MAAQVPTDKVKDKEYSNWLKVTLALYYMKSGLHTFIQNEVDCLHQFLRQKIYGSLAVPLPPCNTCNSHFVRRNKCNGIWTFQKQCKDDCKSYCDVWLSKLLAFHKKPNSEKIYWDNSCVSSWPFNPWECAKVFMPRGQPPSNVGPAQCDAQAMLTMLANCTHFHQKLSPQGLGLTHAISTIRNKVMHDGEMKLSDADRLTYIKQIVQLLEDPVSLKSIDDCKAAVGNIHKIDNDSLDIHFNLDIEMTGLRSAVNDFRQELGLQERKSLDTTDTLKEEYEQLRQQLTERFADVENRLDIIERDIQPVQEQREIHEVLDTHGVRLNKVEKKVQVILMQRRNKKVTLGKRRPKKDVLRRVKNLQVGQCGSDFNQTDTSMTNFQHHLTNEARMKRRSDCLKQLKKTSQTQILGSDRLRQVKSARNYTGNELLEAWPSIEEYLLEELSPEYLCTFFEEENILSAEECTTMCQLRRRQAVEMFLQSIKVKLPEAFLCLLRALNETGQEKKIEEIQKLLTLTDDQEPEEPTPNMAYYTLKLELLKDGNTVHDTEMKTRGHFDRGRILFQYDLKSESLKWDHGSVIVHLRPLKRHTKETLAFFCRHGGMKDFVLDLLKKKDIFASLPEGEMTIHMQVCCYDKESEDGQYGDITQMAEKDVLSPHDGFTVTDDLQLIRKNLLLQYGSVVEEIEPLHFQDTFVAEGIWETDYFENLIKLKRRRARAADFLNKVLDKGNTALAALMLALRKSGNDYVTDRLCFVPEISAQFMDEDQKDKSFIEVVTEELTTDDQEHTVWSCRLNVAVRKNDNVSIDDKPVVIEGVKLEDQEVEQPSATFTKPEERLFEEPKEAQTSLGESGFISHFDKPFEGAKQEDKIEGKSFDVLKFKRTFLGEGAFKNPTKRRKESDELRRLKSQTEDKLDSVRQLEYIPSTQAKVAKELLEGKRSVIIIGNPGAGKTTMALHLTDNEIYSDRRVMIYSPNDWKAVDTDWVDVVILEDILGQFDLDLGRLQNWMVYLPTIQEHVVAGKLQVIITTRADILSKAKVTEGYKLESIKLFSNDLSLTLSSKQLQNSEKMSMLNGQLQRHKKTMNENEMEKCIATFSGLIDFPQCCLLFARDSNLFNIGPAFFNSPEKSFVDNISKLEPTRFLSLVFLFCNGGICEEYLLLEAMPESCKQLLMDLALQLRISEREASVSLLRDVYESFLGLYVVKSISHEVILGSFVAKPCFSFSHAVVCEAVGQVLWDRCPEIVVKFGDAEYLYQRTYTAETQDTTSQKTFIPVSLYGILAERMVYDVVKGLVKSVVKHSALKQHQFLMKLKNELQNSDRVRDFFSDEFEFHVHQDLIEGDCITFLQHLMQSDVDVVTSVYSQLLAFLVCTCKNISTECWQCKEKQMLLELSLYYYHFEITDELIGINACYTHTSLCNAARHGDLRRVQIVLESLKTRQIFNPLCDETTDALCRAYMSGHQDVIEFLKAEITLDIRLVVDVVRQGDINALMKVTELLKCQYIWNLHLHMKVTELLKCQYIWNPHLHKYWALKDVFLQPSMYSRKAMLSPYSTAMLAPYSTALYIAYCKEQFDMASYLVQNGVSVLMAMLPNVLRYSSQQTVSSLIQTLKDTGVWDSNCYDASVALQIAYSTYKYDVCDLLIQDEVLLTMENLPAVIMESKSSFASVKKAIQHLKDTYSWDPKCEDASLALGFAYMDHKYDVCDILIQEGVSLAMKNLPGLCEFQASVQSVRKAMQHLKDSDNWDPNCEDASKALENAYNRQEYDVCNLLVQEGVSLTMKNLPGLCEFQASVQSVKKAMHHLKDKDNWDPNCDEASTALENAFNEQNYDVSDLLVQERVSLTIKNLPNIAYGFKVSFQSVMKAIQLLKDKDNWDPKNAYPTIALETAFNRQKYDVCDLLIQEGVSLTMGNLPGLCLFQASAQSVKKAIQHLKENNNWNPECDDASRALENAYNQQKYDVCDLLVQEGCSLTMKNLPGIISELEESLTSVKEALQQLKKADIWDPKCDYASKALKIAYSRRMYYVCDLLVQEGISLTMKNLHCVILRPLDDVKTVIQQLKDTANWDAKCAYASRALQYAYSKQKYDVCDLLIQEGVSLTMENLSRLCEFEDSVQFIKKAIQHLKDTDNWDPSCDDASKALENAYYQENFDVCDLLVQEGVSLTMKNLHGVVLRPLDDVKSAVKQLKGTDSWDPKCAYASRTLQYAYSKQKYDVCYLLIQEGVSLSMENLPGLCEFQASVQSIKRAIQHLKDSDNWDPKCEDASEALRNTFNQQKYDVCDLLVQEGVSLTMKNLPSIIFGFDASFHSVKKAIKQLQETDNWDPKCGDASRSLQYAYSKQKYDVCDLLIKEGVSLTMKTLSDLCEFQSSYQFVKRAIQHLKEKHIWDPKCDDASKALENAYCLQNYVVCDLLVKEGISVTMKNLPDVILRPLHYVKQAVQQLKDTANWDPKCVYASSALQEAYSKQKYDVCDFMVQEVVSLTMKNLAGICELQVSVQSVNKAILHLKINGNWDPKCDDASKALENAYNRQIYDVCDLLVQEGVSLKIQNLPGVVFGSEASFQSAKKALQQLKDTDGWDPKCDEASELLANAYYRQKYDVCDLLVKEGVSLTMKNLRGVILRSLHYVRVMVQQLKDNANWDPKCAYASRALQYAFSRQKYDVCDLLIQEGVLLSMENLPGLCEFEQSIQFVKKAIQLLKDTDNWDPKCDDASKALENAYYQENYDVCDLLVQEGVSLTMKNLHGVVLRPLDDVKSAVQQLKDTDNWDPKCADACRALQYAFGRQEYELCDLLIHEGISLAMKNLPGLCEFNTSFQFVKKAIQHLKDTDHWNPKCDDASKALENAYNQQNYDVCDFLIEEGVSLTMKNLHGVVLRPLDYVKTAIQQLKDTASWDPKCAEASEALKKAYSQQNYDVCDLLVEEGVSLTMKNLPDVILRPLEYVKAAVRQLKDNANWDPDCPYASRALQFAYSKQMNDVCDILIQEGITLKMKNLPGLCAFQASVQSLKKAIQHLKDSENWDPKCDYASKALENAYNQQKNDVCNLLVQEGVSLTMKNLTGVISGFEASFQSVKKAIQELKDTDRWDPKCEDACKALKYAYYRQNNDVCNLLLQEGVSLKM